MQADRLCDLAEELSTRTKILFLRNKEIPEKSWIVLDIDTLLSKINGRIFAPESLPEHCLTPTHTGVLPWSQIQRHLPDLDPSLVVSFLGRLEFCQVVQDPEVLSLIKFGKNDTSSTVDSDEETGSPISSYRQSFLSQMSTSSSQTYSSGVSNHTTGSGVVSEQDGYPPNLSRSRRESRDGLGPNWMGNLYSTNTSPQRTTVENPSQTPQHSHISPYSSSSGSEQLPQSHVYPSPHNHQTSAPLQQSGNPPYSSAQYQSTSAQQHHPPRSNGFPPSFQNPLPSNTAVPKQPFLPEYNSHQSTTSPTIITSPSLSTPSESQVFSPPAVGSGTGGLLSPLNAKPLSHHPSIVSHSLPSHSPHLRERRRKTSSPPFPSQASKLHDQLHNLNLGKATGGSQPSLPEEQTWLPGGLQFGSLHRSPSDSCTLSSGQQQHQCNAHPKARSHGGSPRMSRHMGCTVQSPVLHNDKFLFFPGLVNSGQPSGEMWLKDPSFVFYSGWCLESAQSHKFFTPRFLQTLILRLAFGFAVSRRPNGVLTSSLSLFSRECTIWKNGLRWLNLDGVETFVEMVEDGRALLLLMRAKKGSELRGVSLRSALIRKILETKEECCQSIPTSEYLIHPKHLQERESYPIITNRLDHLKRYDVNIIAQAIVAEKRRRPCKLAQVCML